MARGTNAPFALRRVELARRRAGEAALVEFFGCPIVFDAPQDRFVFSPELLARSLVKHAARGAIAPEVVAVDRDRTLADDVRVALGARICGERPAVQRWRRISA